jgi:hypothetical protein
MGRGWRGGQAKNWIPEAETDATERWPPAVRYADLWGPRVTASAVSQSHARWSHGMGRAGSFSAEWARPVLLDHSLQVGPGAITERSRGA